MDPKCPKCKCDIHDIGREFGDGMDEDIQKECPRCSAPLLINREITVTYTVVVASGEPGPEDSAAVRPVDRPLRPNEAKVAAPTAAMLARHAAVMASEPIPYKGFLLKPLSHLPRPHFNNGRFTFWGWNILDGAGLACVAPGATWGNTVEQAKEIVDCLIEVGEAPAWPNGVVPVTESEREDYRKYLDARGEWNTRFWALLNEKVV